MATAAIYLDTDEIEELVTSLEWASHASQMLHAGNPHWKQIILALHNAVQGACVCALRGVDTAGITMLEKRSADGMLAWLNLPEEERISQPYPDEWLASPNELFKRVQKEKFMHPAVPLVANHSTKIAFKKLCELRKEFAHFVPKSWSIEISGMPKIVELMTEVIHHLAIAHPSFSRHMEDEQLGRLSKALDELRRTVSNWALANGISR